eukprot:30941-Pelagococcus_subviridis.AAC.17
MNEATTKAHLLLLLRLRRAQCPVRFPRRLSWLMNSAPVVNSVAPYTTLFFPSSAGSPRPKPSPASAEALPPTPRAAAAPSPVQSNSRNPLLMPLTPRSNPLFSFTTVISFTPWCSR